MHHDAKPPPGQQGEGWYLHPGSPRLVRKVGAVLCPAIGFGGVQALRDGRFVVAGLAVAVAGIIGALTFAKRPATLPPSLHRDQTGVGTLLPTHPLRASTVLALAAVGVIFVTSAVILVANRRAADGPYLIGVVLMSVIGVLFLAGSYGGVRMRMTSGTGILLLPHGVVLRTRRERSCSPGRRW